MVADELIGKEKPAATRQRAELFELILVVARILTLHATRVRRSHRRGCQATGSDQHRGASGLR